MNASPQSWNVARYEASHQYVWNFGAGLVELLGPQPGESILDLGCGSGHLTDQIAQSGAAVTGIDSSPEMIAQARINYPHLTFRPADARTYQPSEPFDAVFSNAALHWMKPPEEVAVAIARALKTGGRLVAEFGGAGNIVSIMEAWRATLGNDPSIGEYATLLERHGLAVTNAALFPRPTPLEGEDGVRDWLQMFCGAFLAGRSEREQAGLLDRVEAYLRPMLYQNGNWVVDYCRLRVVARKT